MSTPTQKDLQDALLAFERLSAEACNLRNSRPVLKSRIEKARTKLSSLEHQIFALDHRIHTTTHQMHACLARIKLPTRALTK